MAKITDYTSGIGIKSAENNNNEIILFTQSGLNLIETLTDRTVTYSAGQNAVVGEAYTSAGGRQSSVDTTDTTAIFDTNKYVPSIESDYTGASTANDGYTNPDNAFDNDNTTSATYTTSGTGTQTKSLGKTFSSGSVSAVQYHCSVVTSGASASRSAFIKIQTYNGSVWSDEVTLFTDSASTSSISSGTLSGIYNLGATVQGVRIETQTFCNDTTTNTHTISLINYGDDTTSEIYHDIDTGQFKDDVSSIFFACKIADWEEGATIRAKITNATEDSGWIEGTYDGDEVVWPKDTFTAFTSEPDEFIIELGPKSTSPTIGHPSVYGSSIIVL